MKKRKLIPAFIMLIAGGFASLLMLLWHVEFFPFTRNLLIILIVFYILGQVILFIINKNIPEMEDEPEDEESEEGEGEGEEGEGSEEGEETEETENLDTEDAYEEPPEEEEEQE